MVLHVQVRDSRCYVLKVRLHECKHCRPKHSYYNKMQSVRKWIDPVWLAMVLLFAQSQISSFTGRAGKRETMHLCGSVIHSVKASNMSIVLLWAEDGLHHVGYIQFTYLLLSFFLFPPLFFLLFSFTYYLVTLSSTICSSYLSVPLPFSVYFSARAVNLTDHHRHKPYASFHIQPGSRANGPGGEVGWLLTGEGGVWGGEARRRTETPRQESPCLAALPDQIHWCRYRWGTTFGNRIVFRMMFYEAPSTQVPGPPINAQERMIQYQWLRQLRVMCAFVELLQEKRVVIILTQFHVSQVLAQSSPWKEHCASR